MPTIPTEQLEQFGNGPMTAEAINAATLALKKALIERALGGEMNHHLGYLAGAAKPAAVTNQRNGTEVKTIQTEDGPIRIDVPRDSDGSFDPMRIPSTNVSARGPCESQRLADRPYRARSPRPTLA